MEQFDLEKIIQLTDNNDYNYHINKNKLNKILNDLNTYQKNPVINQKILDIHKILNDLEEIYKKNQNIKQKNNLLFLL